MKTDSQLQRDVTEELNWNPRVTGAHSGTIVKDGIVTLTGSVPHYSEKIAAEETVQRVGGVVAIANELEVKIQPTFERSDDDIAQAAVDALRWNYQVLEGVKVSVDNGKVTLRGNVQWDFQRVAASDTVDLLRGVKFVDNGIHLATQPQPSDIKNRIVEALKRAATTDGQGIKVAVDGDRVALSGTVHSYSEREDARKAAWAGAGVYAVENSLTVAP